MEAEFIDWLRARLPTHRALAVGLGDDAGVIAWRERGDCVISVDVLTDQVDFCLEEVDPRRVGRKALAVNLSDLAAMAAQPVAVVIGLVLPRRGGLELAKQLYEGLIPLAEEFDVAIAGGDTNSWNGPLVISVTVLGQPAPGGVLTRSGAKPGDAIVVTGQFGGSILGHHFDFTPRVREALCLHRGYELHAGVDCSDGLSLDVSHLALASGCGAVLWTAAVPIADAARRVGDGMSPLDHALGDGEDFELILAVPPAEAERMVREQPLDVRLTVIGECVPERGLWQEDETGKRSALTPRGYEH